jgi:hypothetical protein
MLIVRDSCLGVTRFDDSQERLGIARNILNERLTRLVEEGVLATTHSTTTTGSPPRAATRGPSELPCASRATNTPLPTDHRCESCTTSAAKSSKQQ